MKNNTKRQLSRRGILPLIVSTLFLPFLGFGKSKQSSYKNPILEKNNDYQILLRKDGTTVKVKKTDLQQVEIVDQKLSNQSFFSWLTKN